MGMLRKTMAATALLLSSVMLGGCVYDDYGYGGLEVGYGAPGGYGDYGGYGGYYDAPGYGYGYGSGWYNDFYYPGGGYYVFDRSGRRFRWNDSQRRYWQQRQALRGDGRDGRRDFGQGRPDVWRGDRRDLPAGTMRPGREDPRGDRPAFRQDRRQDFRGARGPGTDGGQAVPPAGFRQPRPDGVRQPRPDGFGQSRPEGGRKFGSDGARPPRTNPAPQGGRRDGGIVGRVRERIQEQ